MFFRQFQAPLCTSINTFHCNFTFFFALVYLKHPYRKKNSLRQMKYLFLPCLLSPSYSVTLTGKSNTCILLLLKVKKKSLVMLLCCDQWTHLGTPSPPLVICEQFRTRIVCICPSVHLFHFESVVILVLKVYQLSLHFLPSTQWGLWILYHHKYYQHTLLFPATGC